MRVFSFSARDIVIGVLLSFFVIAVALLILKGVFAWTNPTQAPPGGSGVGVIPAGTVSFYGGSSAPSGWLLCDGSSVSTGTYPNLFSAIGYTYGGSGGNFNLPDMRGRTGVAKGTQSDVATLGNSDGQTVGNRRPAHKHTNNASHVAAGPQPPAEGGNLGNSHYFSNLQIGPQTNSPTDAPAYLVLNCIIKT